MKKMLFLVIFAISIFGKETIPISVNYNPFKKAKRLIQKAKKHTLKNENTSTVKLKVDKKVKKRPPILTGIINKKAFINGRLYKEGERVNGYLIAKIDRDRVTLKTWNNKQVTIYLVDKRSRVYMKEDR